MVVPQDPARGWEYPTWEAGSTVNSTTYISVNEAAARLGTTPGQVRRLADRAELDYRVLIDAESVDNYLQEQQ